MKVSDEHNQATRPTKTPQTPQVDKADSPESTQKDSQTHTSEPAVVGQLSGKSQDLKLAKDAASAALDVLEEKVARLKKKIETGTYKVDPPKIAAKIIEGK